MSPSLPQLPHRRSASLQIIPAEQKALSELDVLRLSLTHTLSNFYVTRAHTR